MKTEAEKEAHQKRGRAWGDWLRREMDRSGVTFEDLAHRAGVASSALRRQVAEGRVPLKTIEASVRKALADIRKKAVAA